MPHPSKFSHIVYKTRHLDELVDWYVNVLECRVQHRDANLAFLSYDEEHHRIAFVNLGPAEDGEPGRGTPDAATINQPRIGMHHVAYTWANLGELLAVYKRLRDQGIKPLAQIRHGLTLSLYYADPDGNTMEFQIDVLTLVEANNFMQGPAFANNPIGETFDADELLVAFEHGKSMLKFVLRSDQALSPNGLASELA